MEDEQCGPLFTDPAQADECAARLGVVADPIRLRIIVALRSDTMAVWQLAELLDEDLDILEEHLQALNAGQIVESDGQANYSLRPGILRISGSGIASIDLGCCRLDVPSDL